MLLLENFVNNDNRSHGCKISISSLTSVLKISSSNNLVKYFRVVDYFLSISSKYGTKFIRNFFHASKSSATRLLFPIKVPG
jgi:hypothetical protein